MVTLARTSIHVAKPTASPELDAERAFKIAFPGEHPLWSEVVCEREDRYTVEIDYEPKEEV